MIIVHISLHTPPKLSLLRRFLYFWNVDFQSVSSTKTKSEKGQKRRTHTNWVPPHIHTTPTINVQGIFLWFKIWIIKNKNWINSPRTKLKRTAKVRRNATLHFVKDFYHLAETMIAFPWKFQCSWKKINTKYILVMRVLFTIRWTVFLCNTNKKNKFWLSINNQ